MKNTLSLFLISLFGSLAATAAPLREAAPAADLTLSPVQIIDYLKWGEIFTAQSKSPELRAFNDVSFIIYDKYIGRPWGEAYYPEATKRWKTFREKYCEQALAPATCALPEKIENDTHLIEAITRLDNRPIVDGLRTALARAGWRYDKISYIGFTPNAGEPPLYNVLVSAHEMGAGVEANVWSLHGPVTIKEKEYVVTYDMAGYRNGFFNDPTNTFLTYDHEGAAVINLDLVKQAATSFAGIWKFKVSKNPAGPGAPSLSNSDEYFLTRLQEARKARFEEITSALTARLEKMQTPGARVTLARFQKDRAAGQYPEETYQQATYDLFHRLATEQAKYFALARVQRAKLNPKRQAWESLLHQQRVTEPGFVLYQLYQEGVFEAGSILSQFANKATVYAYFYETVKAVLALGEFAGKTEPETYARLLTLPDVLDADFLATHAPEALELLRDPLTKRPRTVESLTASERRAFWNAYVHGPNGKVRTVPVFRLALSITLLSSAEEGRALAELIWNTRRAEFEK